MDNEFLDHSFLNDLPLWADEDARRVLEAVCLKIRNVIGVATSLISYEQLHGEAAASQVRQILARSMPH